MQQYLAYYFQLHEKNENAPKKKKGFFGFG